MTWLERPDNIRPCVKKRLIVILTWVIGGPLPADGIYAEIIVMTFDVLVISRLLKAINQSRTSGETLIRVASGSLRSVPIPV